MDYRQGEDERGDWYNNPDLDAQFAAQLQRQFDDEDVLTAQLESTFNFGQRPTLAHSTNPESSNNLKNDEEFARRLQRKIFLDLKNQGFSDIDVASMLDSIPNNDQRQTDTDFEMAIRASLGDEMADQPAAQTTHSFLEKFLLTLYTNCRYESDANVPPPPSDDFSLFRDQVSKSIKAMTEEMLSVEKVVDLMLDKALNSSQWDELEAALFIINSIASQMNTSDLNTQKTRLLQHIILLQPNSNPLLINASTNLIGNLTHWLYNNKHVAAGCVSWILSLPPYESLLVGISQVLEKITALMHFELTESFKSIFDFLPYVELTTDHGAEMEQAALHLIRACAHLLNDRPSDQLVDGLKLLTERPIYALNELASGNNRLEDMAANNSWHVFALNPGLWLQRLYHIFKTLNAWDSQSDYLSYKFAGEYPLAPWSALSHDICEVVCRVIATYSNDKVIVDNCCRCIMQIINTDLSNSSTLIGRLLEELLALYDKRPESYILQLAGSIIDEFTGGVVGAEDTIANFLNAVCIQTDAGIEQLNDNPEIIQNLFSIVNSFTRLRITSFVDKPAAQIMFEKAIACLSVEQREIHKYARTFIYMILQFPRNQSSPQLDSVLQNIGLIMASCFEKLLDGCLRVAFFESSISLISTVSEILAELLLFETQRMDDYLDQTIQRLLAPHSVSEDEIRNLGVQLRNCLSSEDVLNTVICFQEKVIRN